MSQQGNCVSFVQSGNDPVCIGLCPCDTCIKQSPGYCVADETCAGYRTNCSFNSRNQNNCVYPQTLNPNVCTAKNCWGTPHTPPLYINYSVADYLQYLPMFGTGDVCTNSLLTKATVDNMRTNFTLRKLVYNDAQNWQTLGFDPGYFVVPMEYAMRYTASANGACAWDIKFANAYDVVNVTSHSFTLSCPGLPSSDDTPWQVEQAAQNVSLQGTQQKTTVPRCMNNILTVTWQQSTVRTCNNNGVVKPHAASSKDFMYRAETVQNNCTSHNSIISASAAAKRHKTTIYFAKLLRVARVNCRTK